MDKSNGPIVMTSEELKKFIEEMPEGTVISISLKADDDNE